jgi:DNA-binding LacI/PurR family transcriptional regulator
MSDGENKRGSGRRLPLAEIAKRADVSLSSVSYVLNGKGRISPDKRKEIERLLRKAGHSPRTSRRSVIYLMNLQELAQAHTSGPFLAKHMGLREGVRARKSPVQLETLDVTRNLDEQLDPILASKPAGVVLDTNLLEHVNPVVARLQAANVAAVQLGHVQRNESIDAVVVDDFRGGVLAARYLLSKGHKRIGSLRWNVAGDPASERKHAGFKCTLAAAGVELREQDVMETQRKNLDGLIVGRAAMETLMSRSPDLTAVFVENSIVSPGLIYPVVGEATLPPWLAKLELIHFEAWDLDWVDQVFLGQMGHVQRPRIGLSVNWQLMGWLAAERVLNRADGETGQGRCIGVAPTLVVHQDKQATELKLDGM